MKGFDFLGSSILPKTGIINDTRYLNHYWEDGHAECRDRLKNIQAMLKEPEITSILTEVPPRQATDDEIMLVHSLEYYRRIAGTHGHESRLLSPDTYASAGSFVTALLAAGGFCRAISEVVDGRLKNAFALVRPPGHHAEQNRAMGFCLFNNVAIGAMYARRILGLRRVLVVDWDVHHGNGTQHSFERDPDILFFSIHQYPHFPRTGHFTEVGRGRGEGFNMNVPISKGHGDAEYAALVEGLLTPVAREFQPDVILVSAGFDAHAKDPLGGMKMTETGFAVLTRILMNIAGECCGGRLVMCLEGGYDPPSLGACVRAVLLEMADVTRSEVAEWVDRADKKKVTHAGRRSRHVLQPYWPCLIGSGKRWV